MAKHAVSNPESKENRIMWEDEGDLHETTKSRGLLQ
jgi:hypothetical protein